MSLYWLSCACGQRMKVPEKALGTNRRCFKCGEWLAVTPENTAPVDGDVPVDPISTLAPSPVPDVSSSAGRDAVAKPAAPPEGNGSEPSNTGAAPTPPRLAEAGRAPRRDPAKLRIGELLVQEGIVSKAQLELALNRQKEKGGKVVENLIAMDFLDTRTFLNFLSRQPGTASIDLLNYTIPQEVIDLVPADFALRHELLPIDKMGRQLTVGMACPLDSDTVSQLVDMTGMKIRPLLVSMNDIRVALDRYYRPKKVSTFKLAGVSGVSGTKPPAPAAAAPLGPTPDVMASGTHTQGAKEVAAASLTAAELSQQDTLPMVESALTFETVVRLVREVTSLPALPETVREVRAAMERADSSPLEVADIIRRDPSIAAKVLSLANSAAYGFNHHVESVELATSLLGLREIYAVVLSSAVIDYFERSDEFDYKAFWKRSMICATAAKSIAKSCDRKDISGIFAAGLLHDLGRAVLAEVVPQRYKELAQNMPDPELIALENEYFGVAHPEVGYILAKGWKLPVAICDAIRFHHDFKQAQQGRDIVAMVALAALMTDTYGRINKSNVREFAEQCKEILHELQLSEKDFIRVLAETSAAIRAELANSTEPQAKGA